MNINLGICSKRKISTKNGIMISMKMSISNSIDSPKDSFFTCVRDDCPSCLTGVWYPDDVGHALQLARKLDAL